MTTEIAVLNNQGIALAADSLATIVTNEGNEKTIFVRKIFPLSDPHSVALMMYAKADYMGLPWETVVSMFNAQLGTQLDTLEEYANNFVIFLQDNHYKMIGQQSRLKYFRAGARNFLFQFRDKFISEVKSKISKSGPLSESEVEQIVLDFIDSTFDFYKSRGDAPNTHGYLKILTKDESYTVIWKEEKGNILEKLPIPQEYSDKLDKCFIYIMMLPETSNEVADSGDGTFSSTDEESAINPHKSSGFNADVCGVVIAGFGKDDVLPKLIQLEIVGLIGTQLMHHRIRTVAINLEMGAKVFPFAQDDIILRFLKGIDPRVREHMRLYAYQDLIETGVKRFSKQQPNPDDKALRKQKKILRDLAGAFCKQFTITMDEFIKSQFEDVFEQMVSFLDKADLVTIAEALVSLTSIARRIGVECETVGGPTDVAFISKSTGFKWVKKKPDDLVR